MRCKIGTGQSARQIVINGLILESDRLFDLSSQADEERPINFHNLHDIGVGEEVTLIVNPFKVCHTKIDRMRSMGVFPLNSVVCRRMATKLPMKLPNAFLYAKLKSFCGVHFQLLAEIGG